MNDIFRNEEFEQKIKNLKERIRKYLDEKEFSLPQDVTIDHLIGSNNFDGPTKIYATEFCPEEIKGVVTLFIKEEFPAI